MSGASGKTAAAIHVSPEALDGGPLAFVQDGDVIRVDGQTGQMEALGVDLASRPKALRMPAHAASDSWGYGREMFSLFRKGVTSAEEGASVCFAGEGE